MITDIHLSDMDESESLRDAVYHALKKAIMTGVLDEYEVDKGNQKSVIRLSVPVLCSALLWYGGQYL